MKPRVLIVVLCVVGIGVATFYTWNNNTTAVSKTQNAKNTPATEGVPSTREDWIKICHARWNDPQREQQCMKNNANRIGKPLGPRLKKQLEEANQGKFLGWKPPVNNQQQSPPGSAQ